MTWFALAALPVRLYQASKILAARDHSFWCQGGPSILCPPFRLAMCLAGVLVGLALRSDLSLSIYGIALLHSAGTLLSIGACSPGRWLGC